MPVRSLVVSLSTLFVTQSSIVSFPSLLLADLGEKDQARATMTRFLNIHQTTYGKNDPRVAIARTTYADVLRKVGETDLAEEHYLKAVNIYETQFELPNAQLFSDWGQAYAGLAEVSRGKQKTSEALEFYKKAIGAGQGLCLVGILVGC